MNKPAVVRRGFGQVAGQVVQLYRLITGQVRCLLDDAL